MMVPYGRQPLIGSAPLRHTNTLTTSLEKIEGIGEKTIQKLLSHFGSVDKIREAKREEIESLISKSKTATLLLSLKKK